MIRDVLLLGAVALATALAFKFKPVSFDTLVREGGILEMAQVTLYAVAGLLCVIVLARGTSRMHLASDRFVLMFIAAFSLIFAAEEMSWGTGLLGWEAPVVANEVAFDGIHDVAAIILFETTSFARNHPWPAALALLAIMSSLSILIWIYRDLLLTVTKWVGGSQMRLRLLMALVFVSAAQVADFVGTKRSEVAEEYFELASALVLVAAALDAWRNTGDVHSAEWRTAQALGGSTTD